LSAWVVVEAVEGDQCVGGIEVFRNHVAVGDDDEWWQVWVQIGARDEESGADPVVILGLDPGHGSAAL